MSDNKKPFWALLTFVIPVKLAGLVSEERFAGQDWVKIEVPQLSKNHPAFEELFFPEAIASITPVDEESAKILALENPNPYGLVFREIVGPVFNRRNLRKELRFNIPRTEDELKDAIIGVDRGATEGDSYVTFTWGEKNQKF